MIKFLDQINIFLILKQEWRNWNNDWDPDFGQLDVELAHLGDSPRSWWRCCCSPWRNAHSGKGSHCWGHFPCLMFGWQHHGEPHDGRHHDDRGGQHEYCYHFFSSCVFSGVSVFWFVLYEGPTEQQSPNLWGYLSESVMVISIEDGASLPSLIMPRIEMSQLPGSNLPRQNWVFLPRPPRVSSGCREWGGWWGRQPPVLRYYRFLLLRLGL